MRHLEKLDEDTHNGTINYYVVLEAGFTQRTKTMINSFIGDCFMASTSIVDLYFTKDGEYWVQLDKLIEHEKFNRNG